VGIAHRSSSNCEPRENASVHVIPAQAGIHFNSFTTKDTKSTKGFNQERTTSNQQLTTGDPLVTGN
jgi:hypothetical protein